MAHRKRLSGLMATLDFLESERYLKTTTEKTFRHIPEVDRLAVNVYTP